MFHKKDDALSRLNQELLEAEEEEWLEDDDALDEEEVWLEQESDQLDSEEPPEYEGDFEGSYEEEYAEESYIPASYYGKGQQKYFDDDGDYDDDLEEGAVVYSDEIQKKKKKGKKGIRNLGLTVIAILEIIAIGAIAIWWATWML